MREALGGSLRVQAARLGIAAPTLHKSESSEVEGRIALAQLRKLAEGLDCEVVYALIPRLGLSQMVKAQANMLARQEVLGVAHSMSLEDNQPGQTPLDADEAAQLIPRHAATQNALDEWEQANILRAVQWAARFHPQLVLVHRFPNGNGRYSRLMTDCVMRQNATPRFSRGGAQNLADAGATRQRYIAALRAADAGDIALLMAFVRS